MQEIPEKDLIAGLKGKDSQICKHVFLTYFPVLLSYISYKVPNREDAKDIAQESLIALCVKAESFPKMDTMTDVKKILYGIARNKMGSYLRNKIRSDSFTKEYVGHTALNEELYADARIIRENEIHLEVYKYLNTLSGQPKEIINLLYENNYTIREISETLQTSEGNVRNQLYKVRMKLKNIVEKYKGRIQTVRLVSALLF